MVSSDNLMTVVGKSSGCCSIVGLEVRGHIEAGATVEAGSFGDGGNEPPVTGSSSEKVSNGVCDESWKWETPCGDGGDWGAQSIED